jgi:hypothetical protein
MNKYILCLLLLIGSMMQPILLQAQTTSLFQFLRFGQSARSAGMGGAMLAVEGDNTGVMFNPAMVGTAKGRSVDMTVLKHISDINSGFLLFSDTLESIGGRFSTGVVYTNYGTFERADEFGTKLGTFGGLDLAVQGTYAASIDTSFYYGATVKFLMTSFEDIRSTALAVDAGVLYKLPKLSTNVAFSVLHTGAQLTATPGAISDLPFDMRLGVNHRLKGLPLLLNLTLYNIADKNKEMSERLTTFTVGGEFYLSSVIRARVGYDNGIRQGAAFGNAGGLSGVSFGVGLVTDYLNFDYAFSSINSAVLLNRISLYVPF